MVVYVDDDREDAEIILEVLQSYGEVCSWHQDATEIFRPLPYQMDSVKFLLLDIDMPTHNGFEVLSMAHSNETWANTPVIMFSGSISGRDISRAFLTGATYYLQKPATYSKLEESVKFLLSVDWKNFTPTPENFVFERSLKLELPDQD